jgi:ribonuclease VapC
VRSHPTRQRAYPLCTGRRPTGRKVALRVAQLVVEPVTPEQARIARDAYRDFGRGSGHPAGLNFGDCFAYGLAKVTGEPLLYKGGDLVHTDVA